MSDKTFPTSDVMVPAHDRLYDAAGSLVDHLMNDPDQQQKMNDWINQEWDERWGPIERLPTETEEEHENSARYTLYYAMTVEWHASVLGRAITHLRNVK